MSVGVASSKVCSVQNLSVLEGLNIDFQKRVRLCVVLYSALERCPDDDILQRLFSDSVFDLETSCSDFSIWEHCLRSETDMDSGLSVD
jgi:hypothetical protein